MDAASVAGPPPHCPDLLDAPTPTTLVGPAATLTGDPTAGTAQLSR